MPLQPSTVELIAHCHAVVAEFNARYRQAVADLPGNPGMVHVQRFGEVWATRCDLPGAPAWMQRLAPVRAQDVEQLPRALEWFAALRPEIETAPLPGHDTLARTLSRHGAVQTGFLDLLRGDAHHIAVHATRPLVQGEIEVAQVDAGDAMLFARTLLRGHVETYYEHEVEGLATMIGTENLHHYLARVDGQPAAAAILSLHGGIAYLANASALPDHRNRGCHSALIAARMRDAVAAGCDTVIGLAEVGSTSHRNMERAGLHTLATIAAWTFPRD